MNKIIIDTDPGHDDAIAILVAGANKELNIIALSTVTGNQTLEKVNKNALNLVSYLDLSIPVVSGADCPILKEVTIGDGLEIHGESGMDGFQFPSNESKITSDNAVGYMYELLVKSQEKVMIVTIGPMTNVARLLRLHPEVKERILSISMMGGAIKGGNITPDAEFNIYADPDAAKIVFDSGIPIVMSGLDVTEKAYITFEEINENLSSNGPCTKMVKGLLDFYSQYFKTMGSDKILLHDVCAILYIIHPELFKGSQESVDVEVSDGALRGKTTIKDKGISELEKNVLVLNEVDRRGLLNYIFEAINFYDSKITNKK